MTVTAGPSAPGAAADAVWWQHVERACAAGRFGDAALLAGEAATPALAARARRCASAAARQQRQRDPPDAPPSPRRVLLFSGHRVDAPGRVTPRFPAAAVPRAARRIEDVLDRLDAGPGDLALTQGASGGDLLFGAAVADRGVRLVLLLPLPVPTFIATSVAPEAACTDDPTDWPARWTALQPRLAEPPRVMDDALGPVPDGVDPWERANRWLFATALAAAPPARLNFICLWNGAVGDGPGGTDHLVAEVRRRRGRVDWIDSRELLGS